MAPAPHTWPTHRAGRSWNFDRIRLARLKLFATRCSLVQSPALHPHRKDDLPFCPPAGEQVERLGGLFEWQRLRHMRPQPPFTVPAGELLHALGERARLAAREVAPEYADHCGTLEQR